MTIGAQRLYKAVKTGDVSTTMLCLTSSDMGEFTYQEVFNHWRDNGRNPEMLGVLLTYPPFLEFDYRRYRRGTKWKANHAYRFGYDVVQDLNQRISESNVEWLRAMVSVFVSVGQDKQLSHLARNLCEVLNTDEHPEWPWGVAALSRSLGFHVGCFTYKKREHQLEALEWLLDMHGPVTAADDMDYYSGIIYLHVLGHDRYEDIVMLLPSEELQKSFFKENYYARNMRDNAISGHKTFLALTKAMPWIK